MPVRMSVMVSAETCAAEPEYGQHGVYKARQVYYEALLLFIFDSTNYKGL